MNEDVARESISRLRVECPIWHRPLLYVVANGIEVRCGSCKKEIHHISRSRLEELWSEIGQSQNSDVAVTNSIISYLS